MMSMMQTRKEFISCLLKNKMNDEYDADKDGI